MKIIYTELAFEQLKEIKSYISKDSKNNATNFLAKIKTKIELLAEFPHLGQINKTLNKENIREFVVLGFKLIYEIEQCNIIILTIYKQINFNEENLFENKN